MRLALSAGETSTQRFVEVEQISLVYLASESSIRGSLIRTRYLIDRRGFESFQEWGIAFPFRKGWDLGLTFQRDFGFLRYLHFAQNGLPVLCFAVVLRQENSSLRKMLEPVWSLHGLSMLYNCLPGLHERFEILRP